MHQFKWCVPKAFNESNDINLGLHVFCEESQAECIET